VPSHSRHCRRHNLSRLYNNVGIAVQIQSERVYNNRRNMQKSARDIFFDDEVKFHSCLTLFSLTAPDDPVFREALDLFFDGEVDERTVTILSAQDGLSQGR
jgi:uncharacterized protein (DUF1810 family)